MTSPERIPLLVTVGVSGHRKPDQLGDVDTLRETVAGQFSQLANSFRKANGNVQFLLFSPLADGADRLLVDAVWQVQPEARLIVPMPFEQAQYEASFFDARSVEQFRGYLRHPNCIEAFVLPGGTQGEYLDVGKFVVDHSDIMFFLRD